MTATERMYQCLAEKGKRPVDLCRFLGISSSLMAGWKMTADIPPSKYLVKISEFLEITVDYLLTGERKQSYFFDDSKKHVSLDRSAIVDYRRQMLHLKDDTVAERFIEARKASNITLEDAAARAYIALDDLKQLEKTGEYTTEKIGPDQIACLAYLYDVDLYWLLCGKVRPPAAVIQNGEKVYPPYEFMLEQQSQKTITRQPDPVAFSNLDDDERDMLSMFALLNDEGKKFAQYALKGIVEGNQNLGYSRHPGTRHKQEKQGETA